MDTPRGREKDVFDFYRSVKGWEVLREWRKNVPRDARREWIRFSLREKGIVSLSEEQEFFLNIIKRHVSKSSFEEIKGKIARMQGINDGDRASEEAQELEYMMAGLITDDMLEDFARVYLASFETDARKRESFFRERKKVVEGIRNIVQTCVDEGGIVASLYSIFPAVLTMEDGSVYEVGSMEDFFQLNSPRNYASALVVYGSAALGPRKDNSEYGRKQDIDILFIPRVSRGQDLKTVEHVCASVSYVNFLLQQLIAGSDEVIPDNIRKKMGNVFPALVQFASQCNKEGVFAEIHSPSLPDKNLGFVSDWGKLCGPHQVVATMRDGWEQDYQFFLQAAIKSARMKEKQ